MKLQALKQLKKRRQKWVMMTAYDAPTAELLDQQGVDVLLVGDSVGMVLLGYDSTAPVTMEEMLHHAKAVRRGAPKATVIGDLPLLGVARGARQALASARRFVKEAGCQAVKLEWGPRALESTRQMVQSGIPVMGHVGLTPQSAAQEGGYKVRGRQAEKAMQIAENALAFEKAGAFSVLLECVPAPVARAITKILKIPTVGIGAGPDCDGQVLVCQDVTGAFHRFRPRFAKRYGNVYEVSQKAVARFVRDVRQKKYPQKEHTFAMPPQEQKRFRALLSAR